jgi:hypothetical protein
VPERALASHAISTPPSEPEKEVVNITFSPHKLAVMQRSPTSKSSRQLSMSPKKQLFRKKKDHKAAEDVWAFFETRNANPKLEIIRCKVCL